MYRCAPNYVRCCAKGPDTKVKPNLNRYCQRQLALDAEQAQDLRRTAACRVVTTCADYIAETRQTAVRRPGVGALDTPCSIALPRASTF